MRVFYSLSVLALTLSACSQKAPTPNEADSAEAVVEETPAAALDRMDERAPVPLMPMMALHQKEHMRDHLVAVQEIVLALAEADFEGVEKAAGRIGFSEQMGRMCTHMGAGAKGFTEQGLDFHHTADRIALAAKERNSRKILEELGATLKTCTSCHSAWKQRVVSEAEWQELTGSKPPMQAAQD